MRRVKGRYRIRLKCGYISFKRRSDAFNFLLEIVTNKRWAL